MNGNGQNAMLQAYGHDDPADPQQGMLRQMMRTLYTAPDTARLRQELPAIMLNVTMRQLQWVNQLALPLRYSEVLTTTFRRVIFSRPRPEEVPPEGIARFIDRASSEFSVSSARYGLGAKFELDRLKLPE
jgi:hypothetical protein